MKYDYDLQCYIDAAGIVQDCGHPARMRPDCCNGGKYAGRTQIDARAAEGIEAITAGDVEIKKQEPVSAAAFDLAIMRGILSDDPAANNYAGKYMHMGSMQFKNINTREYITP